MEDLHPQYLDPIRELMNDTSLPWRFALNLSPWGGVARARNKLASDFIKCTDAEILLFVDYDLCPTKQDYIKILTWDWSLPILGGIYTQREEGSPWVYNPVVGAPIQPNGLLQVFELATGFKRFTRQSLMHVIQSCPWFEHEPDDRKTEVEWGFFSMGIVDINGKKRWLTEDFWFDSICRAAGLPIIIDTNLRIKHRQTTGKEKGKLFPVNEPQIHTA